MILVAITGDFLLLYYKLFFDFEFFYIGIWTVNSGFILGSTSPVPLNQLYLI